ncbi:zinc finger protein ztf-16 isoform X2 [Bacillus rossius redtenbacheri]|uniref:zinc finger protein ztf-16 isoform X2 n=1 Tax=Bacillus rossius redtenbacheri TaxID=93214 RepID=UPI002FDEB8B0
MAEPDRSSTNGTPENDNEADSGTPNDCGNSNEEGCDQDNEADQSGGGISPGAPDGSINTNYDSSDGVLALHQCDRCENFETLTHTALLAHLAQCVGGDGDATADGLRNHDRKIFECDVCNMKFSNGANMRRHKMRHTGVKPYECRVCQKRFFRKDHLAEHFTTHTKTLPYHCPICNRGFQRQIAMRAHFQNEHVGQHDMVKSCPLCTYRANSMKTLRVHFFNRHGIDLDNPGPSSQAVSSALPGGHCSPLEANVSAAYSDSGDSLGARSVDNATPPMHFLTPHVEISMADAPASFSAACDPGSATAPQSSSGDPPPQQPLNGDCPSSPNSGDSSSNAPSSSLAAGRPLQADHDAPAVVTPSISLIPIKQELVPEERPRSGGPVNLSTGRGCADAAGGIQFQSATSSSLSTLIKVSPLKSLLRDDLKRKITQNHTVTSRGRPSSGSPRPESSFSIQPVVATTTNGAITSTGPEQPLDSTAWQPPKRVVPSLQCAFCGIAFPDQTLYFLHKGCHSDSNPWKCNICGEQCSNVYEFNSHLLSKTHQ